MKTEVRRIIQILLAIILLCFAGTAIADTLYLPENLEIIDEEAFMDDTSLGEVVLPEGLKRIESKAFKGSSLREIVLPSSLRFIADDAFEGPDQVTVTATDGTYAYDWAVDNGYIYDTQESPIGWFSFSSKGNGTCQVDKYVGENSYGGDIVIPSQDGEGRIVTAIGTRAFDGCSELSGSIVIPDSVTSVGYSAFGGCASLTSIRLSDNLKSIGSSAFKGCTGLTSIMIPDGVTSIGYSTFAECTCLTNIVLPDHLISINSSAFKDCTSLISIILPDTLTSIGNSAFFNCSSLTSLTIPEGVDVIDIGSFSDCSSLTSIIIPDGVTSIGNSAFDNCSSLTSITIPGSVESIDGFAFYNCIGLTSVTLRQGVTMIGDNAFDSCSSLTSIILPDSMTAIGKYAFYNCTSLESVVLPDSLTSISDSAFYNCTGLASVTFPRSVIRIGNRAFQGCSSLTTITLPNSVTSIGDQAFGNCTSLTVITIPDGVTSIGDFVFTGCSSLASITIPDSVVEFGGSRGYPFNGYDGAYYCNLESPAAYYLSSTYCSFRIQDANYDLSYIFDDDVVVGLEIRNVDKNVETFDVPGIVTSIGRSAFENCRWLTSINIPNSVTDIGSNAFKNCIGLTSIRIPNGVASIGFSAFAYCSGLTSVIIPRSVTSIDSFAFEHCTSLSSITIPNSVTDIGNYAFEYCSGLTNITLSNNLTTINHGTFTNCTNLTSITLPENITSISGFAFSECKNLTEIKIPESVASIDNNAFPTYRFYAMYFYAVRDSWAWNWAQSHVAENRLIPWDGYSNTVEEVEIGEEIQEGQPRVISITMPEDTFIQTGDTVVFGVSTENATSVTLVVDGVCYDTVSVTNNQVEISRVFTLGGLREIAFQANANGSVSTVTQAGSLMVYAQDVLDEPKVSVSGSYNTGANLTVSWNPVEHATSYVIYLYHEGTQLLKYTVSGSETNYPLNSSLLTETGNYSVNVYAVAPGFSQHGGSCFFSLSEFAPYNAYLQQNNSVIYQDAQFTAPMVEISRSDTLQVLYSDDTLALVRVSTADGDQEGFIPSNQIGETQWVAESTIACWYSRKNRLDPDSPVTITIHASVDMDRVTIDVNGQVYDSTDGKPIQGDENLKRYLIQIPAVKSQSTYPITGCAGTVVKKNTNITIAPVAVVGLAAPQLGEYANLAAGKNVTLTWTGSTGATAYEVTITLGNSTVLGPTTVENPSVDIPGTAINLPGNYMMTVTAKNSTQTSTASTATLTVSSGRQCYYLQAETWNRLYSYDRISMHDLVYIQSETASAYNLQVITRTGEVKNYQDVPKLEVALAKQKYNPHTAPVFSGDIKYSGVDEGSVCHIEVNSCHTAEKAEFFVDNVLVGPMAISRENYSALWVCDWMITPGNHTMKVMLTGSNGLTTIKEKSFQAYHHHTPDFASAVLDTSRITDHGVHVQSVTCTACGQQLGNFDTNPAYAFPQIDTSGSTGICFKESMTSDRFTIQMNTGSVMVNAGVVLDIPTITCKELRIRGTLKVHNIQADHVIVEGAGQLIMDDNAFLKTRDFTFSSSKNHSSLLTGGEMSITGDMTVNSAFTPGNNHRTVFTSGSHRLNNVANTRFGILVVYGGIGDLASRNAFTYQYVVLSKSAISSYHVSEPTLPANLVPYTKNGDARSLNESAIRSKVREDTYRSYQGKVKFDLNIGNIYDGTYFSVVRTTNNAMLEGSLNVAILQQIALDALADFAGLNADTTCGSLLATGNINYSDSSFYDVRVGDSYKRVRYSAQVSGIGVGNNVSLGMLSITYTEWYDGTSTRYTNTYQLVPTDAFAKKTKASMMQTMHWNGKELAEKTVKETSDALIQEMVNYFVEVGEFENAGRVITAVNTLRDTASLNTDNAPLLRVYTANGSMEVYEAQVTGSWVYSDICRASYRGFAGK